MDNLVKKINKYKHKLRNYGDDIDTDNKKKRVL